MPPADLLVVVATTAAVVIVVGALATVLLRLLRRASIITQLLIVVTAAVVTIATSTVLVAQSTYVLEHDVGLAVGVAVIAGVLAVVTAGVLGTVAVRNSSQLVRAARLIGEGERFERLETSVNAEMASLADELSSTSTKLAESRARELRIESSRRELIAWISHDLRTPLAGIRAMAEALEDGLAEDPARYHRQTRIQAEQLSLMVDDLFELSKIDAGLLRLSRQDISLVDLVSDTIADLRPLSGTRQIRLEAPTGQDAAVWADPRELSRAVANLLLNALQHSTSEAPVVVRAAVTPEHVHVTVTDSGGGIAEADQDRVFEPGWRGSNARTPAAAVGRSAGAGLGLAIVRGILEAHDGQVRVRNVVGGACFEILLPRADRSSHPRPIDPRP